MTTIGVPTSPSVSCSISQKRRPQPRQIYPHQLLRRTVEAEPGGEACAFSFERVLSVPRATSGESLRGGGNYWQLPGTTNRVTAHHQRIRARVITPRAICSVERDQNPQSSNSTIGKVL